MSDSETAPVSTLPAVNFPSLSDPSAAALRPTEVPVDPLFRGRWSPRAFSPVPLEPLELQRLFEAARWAPSSGNEQPWLFVYATSPQDRARFSEGLLPFNQAWAARAPLLTYLFTRKTRRDGKPYPHSMFDAGAAWMSFALQAHLQGLAVHGMGGIVPEKAYEVTGVDPDQYQVVIAIAGGHRGDPTTLPAALAEREVPSQRQPQSAFVFEGRWSAPPGGP